MASRVSIILHIKNEKEKKAFYKVPPQYSISIFLCSQMICINQLFHRIYGAQKIAKCLFKDREVQNPHTFIGLLLGSKPNSSENEVNPGKVSESGVPMMLHLRKQY